MLLRVVGFLSDHSRIRNAPTTDCQPVRKRCRACFLKFHGQDGHRKPCVLVGSQWWRRRESNPRVAILRVALTISGRAPTACSNLMVASYSSEVSVEGTNHQSSLFYTAKVWNYKEFFKFFNMGNVLAFQEGIASTSPPQIAGLYRMVMIVNRVDVLGSSTRVYGMSMLSSCFSQDDRMIWGIILKDLSTRQSNWVEMYESQDILTQDSSSTSIVSSQNPTSRPSPFLVSISQMTTPSAYGWSMGTGFWIEFPSPFNLFPEGWNQITIQDC